MKRKREEVSKQEPFSEPGTLDLLVLQPESLTRSVSPPLRNTSRTRSHSKSTAAQVEAGERNVDDHLSFFSKKLLAARRPLRDDALQTIDPTSWISLYKSNVDNPRGHHFVIHQHDHPVAGTHYDLRLQCNRTSSVSWAIMYGLPGDPNSRRRNRNATETRIHCIWNHLIETASHQTGTLLIWDTGRYDILPYQQSATYAGTSATDSNNTDSEATISGVESPWSSLSQPEKLAQSFQNRKIRLRLHGQRLPQNYTITLRLSKDNDRSEQPGPPKIRRRKGAPSLTRSTIPKRSNSRTYVTDSSSSSDSSTAVSRPTNLRRSLSSLQRYETPPLTSSLKPTSLASSAQPSTPINESRSSSVSDTHPSTSKSHSANHSTDHPDKSNNVLGETNNIKTKSQTADEEEDALIRQNNAYPGSTNSIGSIHQRKWYMSLDPINSGFVRTHSTSTLLLNNNSSQKTKSTQIWTPRQQTSLPSKPHAQSQRLGPGPGPGPGSGTRPSGSQPFHVLGRDHERSIVTGRLASEILEDEGVVGFVPRGRWRGVVE